MINSSEIQENIQQIIASHKRFNERVKDHVKVGSTRQLGVIYAIDLAIDMDRYGKKRYEIFEFLMKRGVCLRPLGKTVYILPPYVTTEEQLEKIYQAISDLLEIV